MRKILQILTASLILHFNSNSQTPATGPYYFVSDDAGGAIVSYSEGIEYYGGIPMTKNLNLLATVLGDNASSLVSPGETLVPKETFTILNGTVNIQPFAFTAGTSSKKINLPIGSNLRRFLQDPLGGAKFDLTLPFTDQKVSLSDHSGAVRQILPGGGGSIFHFAIDFDRNDNTTSGFDIIAAADGVIEGNHIPSGGSDLVIRHTASNGTVFLTYYQHLVPRCNNLAPGATVKRGDKIGRVEQKDSVGNPAYTHLHFGVAVKGPARSVNGVNVPEMWYEIDPFGIYDYRRNISSTTTYNYLPNNTMVKDVQGIIGAYAFRTNAPVGSLLLPEDCLSFNPDNAAIQNSSGVFKIVDGNQILFSFPNLTEARQALAIIKTYKINKTCFVGRPDPSLTYLLVNNQSPVNAVSGDDCLSFNPASITLNRLSDGRYQMISGTQILFVFPNMLEAGNALSIIKKYGFTKACYVGRPQPSLQYFRN